MNLDRRLLAEAWAAWRCLALAVGTGLLAGVAVIFQAHYLSRSVSAVFLEEATLDGVRTSLTLLLAAIVARSGLVWAREVLAARAAARIKARLRSRLFANLLALGPVHASGERTGELANTLVEGVEALDAYYSQYLPNLALAVLIPLAILLFVFPLDLLTGMVFLLTAPLIPIFMILIGKLAELLTRRQWESLSRMNAHFLDVLQGLTTLKLFNRSRAQAETIGRITDRFRDTTLGVLKVAFLSALVLEIVGSISTAIVAVEVGLRLLYSTITFEQALFILVLAPEFYLTLRTLGASFHAGMSGAAAARRIFEILGDEDAGTRRRGGAEKEEKDRKNNGQDQQESLRPLDGYGYPTMSCTDSSVPLRVSASPRESFSASPCLPVAPHRIAFDDIHLSYDGGERQALRGVSFEVEAGQKVALVGPSGSGKSSLASLLLRFVEPDHGEILVDGVPLRDISSDEWWTRVAWVPQSPFLFAATVAENIRIGRPQATDVEVRRAAELARAAEFIDWLPAGYDTPIGERGARLSGGQAQRIALARAFLKDAPVLILDEPTSNLDPQHEALVQDAIEELMEGRTTLVIAHRLGTVSRMDRVIVLQDGIVAETGTPAELARGAGPFRRLAGAYCGDVGTDRSTGQSVNLTVAAGFKPARTHDEVTTRRLKPAATGSSTPAMPNGRDTRDETPGYHFPVSPTPPLSHSPALSSWTVLWRLGRLVAPFKWWIALSVLLGFATVGSGIGLIATASFLIASAALHPSVADLAIPIVGVRFFGISRGVFRYLERYVSHNLTFRLLGRLRVWFYEAVEPLAPARLMAYRSGDLLNRVVADIESLQHFYVRVIAPSVVALLVGFAMWLFVQQFDSGLALLLAAFLILSAVVLPAATYWLSFRPGNAATKLRSDLSVRLVDGLQGMADLLVFGHAGRQMERINALSGAWIDTQLRLAWVAGLGSALSTLLASLGMWALLVAAIPLVNAGHLGGIFLPVLALAALASFEAVSALPLAAQQLSGSLEAGRRLLEIVDGETGARGDAETRRGGDAGKTGEQAGRQAESLAIAGRSRLLHITHHSSLVMFDNVSFRYGPSEPLAVDGVSFDLARGRRLAIVGPSGAGKSTLVNLLVRFWDYEGSIVLDGRELRDYQPEDARQLIAVVPQRTHLFNATIRENLLIARPQATEEDLVRAARQARLHGFVERLPHGYDTWVGEQGIRLSGGERQRIAIARALLKEAPLLVLDEPASNLDSLTEREIMETLRDVADGRTVLTITHRLAELEAMDEILVIRDGSVVERGSHTWLLNAGGLYCRMWALRNRALGEE